jgi:polyferredoxin
MGRTIGLERNEPKPRKAALCRRDRLRNEKSARADAEITPAAGYIAFQRRHAILSERIILNLAPPSGLNDKIKTFKGDKMLRLLKYVIFAVFVVLLPSVIRDLIGQGTPWFCKLICPAGTLQGGIPLLAASPMLRTAIGPLFWWKVALLALTALACLFIYRPFCKYICPLGAFYALFNRISLMRMELNENSCVHCRKCMVSCPMQVDVLKNINSAECIRCGKCAQVCPTGAIDLKFGKITVRKNEI